MIETEPQTKIRSTCRNCGKNITHDVLKEYSHGGRVELENELDFAYTNYYRILRCAGCQEVSFMHVHEDTDDYDPETGAPNESIRLYPECDQVRDPVAGSNHFPDRVQSIYEEVLRSLSNRTPILTAIGLRAILESICIETHVKGENLRDKINDLVKQGYISKNQSEILHDIRFLGNEAAHEIAIPRPKELIVALDIAETMLRAIYVLPKIARDITTGRNERKPLSGTALPGAATV